MIDHVVRPLLEQLHRPMAAALGRRVHPHAISLIGFALGIASAGALLDARYPLALVLWILNRAADGLDGTLARSSARQSDFGGYLDIMLDFVVYAAIPIALVLGLPGEVASRSHLPLALLLASFYVNSASWMYLAAVLEKRGHAERAATTVVMPSGLIEATETMLLYCVLIVLPAWAPELMMVMTMLVLITACQRLFWGFSRLK